MVYIGCEWVGEWFVRGAQTFADKEFVTSDSLVAKPFTRPTSAWFVVAGLLVLMAILSRVGMISHPFFNDSGQYVVMGRTVAQGGMLYVGSFFSTPSLRCWSDRLGILAGVWSMVAVGMCYVSYC